MKLLHNHGTNDAGTSGLMKKVDGSGTIVAAWGTWGGATITLQYSEDNTNWVSTGITMTADTFNIRRFLPTGYYRGLVSGGTGHSVNLKVSGGDWVTP